MLASHVRNDLTALDAALVLALTPGLVLVWIRFVERRPLSSIGLRRLTVATLMYGLAGVVFNVCNSVAVSALSARLGMHEAESDFARHLVSGGHGWALVVFAAGGALLTEIAFRGYALSRLQELGSPPWLAAAIQILLTSALFLVSRPAHALVWMTDDAVFTAFYFWRRDTTACVIAHLAPNALAAMLVALQLAQ